MKIKKQKVVFLCYSQYVIFIASILREVYHIEDHCSLIVSDVIENGHNLVEHIKQSEFWDDVLLLPEKDKSPDEIHFEVDKYLSEYSIDIFYTSHIMRCASHYFVHILPPDNVKINMFDEGIISLDIIGGYKHWDERVNRMGWYEFEFSKVREYYVLFPEITTAFYDVKIKKIDISKISNNKTFLSKINQMFEYEYESFRKPYIIIDADLAKQGEISSEVEVYCAQKMIDVIGKDNCAIKIKPSETKEVLEKKYGKEQIEYITNGKVPFEIVFLNAIAKGDIPKCIVAFPTTLIWNLALIAGEFDGVTLNVISIAKIVSKFYYIPGSAYEMLKKIQAYQNCLKTKIALPESWDELYELIHQNIAKNYKPIDDENKWLLQEYNRIQYNRVRRCNYSQENYYLRSLLAEHDNARRMVEQFVRKNVIDKIVLYGTTFFAEKMFGLFEEVNVEILYVIKTYVNEEEIFHEKTVISFSDFMNMKCDVPIIICAVDKAIEINDIIKNYKISNKAYMLKEILIEK